MIRRLTVVLALAALLGGVAFAATVCPLPLANLAKAAERIVAVTVESIEHENHEGQVYTVATCKVDETIKGPEEKSIKLRLPGGRFGGYTMIVPGAPVLRKGERYIVFLTAETAEGFSRDAWRTIGLGQGLFKLVNKDGRTYAIQAMAQAPEHFDACDSSGSVCLRHLHILGAERSDFVAQIRDALTSTSEP